MLIFMSDKVHASLLTAGIGSVAAHADTASCDGNALRFIVHWNGARYILTESTFS